MKFYVAVEIPFEATDGQQAMDLADRSLRARGFVNYKVLDVESEDSRTALEEYASTPKEDGSYPSDDECDRYEAHLRKQEREE